MSKVANTKSFQLSGANLISALQDDESQNLQDISNYCISHLKTLNKQFNQLTKKKKNNFLMVLNERIKEAKKPQTKKNLMIVLKNIEEHDKKNELIIIEQQKKQSGLQQNFTMNQEIINDEELIQEEPLKTKNEAVGEKIQKLSKRASTTLLATFICPSFAGLLDRQIGLKGYATISFGLQMLYLFLALIFLVLLCCFKKRKFQSKNESQAEILKNKSSRREKK